MTNTEGTMNNTVVVGKKEETLTFTCKPASNSTELRSTIKLPELEGDTQIFLGQTIVTLIRLNIENDECYSKDQQHYFKAELMASVLEELNISLDDIAKIYNERNLTTDY